MPYKDIEKKRAYDREWKKRNRASQRKYYRKLRIKVLDIFGGKCVYCGCDIREALEINHINGRGCREKQKRSSCTKKFYLDIISGRRTIDDLELTCKVCNVVHYLVKLKGLPPVWKVIFRNPCNEK